MRLSAAEALVNQLASYEVDRIFCVPGESYLAALDALYDHKYIEVVACRHEGGAGFMALADAKLTNRPGVLFTSRGPGAMNAAISLHAAQQDGIPLLAFIGHVTRKELGRGAFQEVDYGTTFGDIAKKVIEIHDGSRMYDLIAQAWQFAISGTPGPVVIVLPEDMLEDHIDASASAGPPRALCSGPTTADLEAVAQRLSKAQRPLLIAGSQIGSADAKAALCQIAEQWGLPVLGAFKQQDVMANDHPHWIGQVGFVMNPVMADALKETDLILAVGTRLGDITTQGFTFPASPLPEQDVIHVYPDAEKLGRNIAPWMGIVADSGSFLSEFARHPVPPTEFSRSAWVGKLTQRHRELTRFSPKPSDLGVDLGCVVIAVDEYAPPNTLFCLDSGNFATWVHRYLTVHKGQHLLGSASGAMGSGVPFAVSAAMRHPEHTVIAFMGDGGALMNGNEIATAVHHGANIKLIIADNAVYGTIKGFQEKLFPGRPVATSLTNPDFVAWAESFGVKGYSISEDADADHVIEAALTHDGPVVVHVKQSAERLNAFSP
ncbi:thiamine pyrophosphate-dependent enzyme [Halomonas salipaludis]|uniref:Acetolactate synthase n=1 Tax=Halomonas salipaludis TaxID=2032625 RepID=A0A2A2EY15_9GAMM|nr:thiamine pyrophosphate-dependent enzyme [Halomonas salipaludis]PAU77242.1 acetolactate synthase [Halomonas salipaludis]